jgi:hypothetical protein
MNVRILAAVVALAGTTALGQVPGGEISGRMRAGDRSALPGVRITITDANQSQETVTDRDGRFSFRSLEMGTYRVVADLAGFRKTSGQITLTPATPGAVLTWSLEIGCLAEIQRVILPPRDAARLVEAIVHIRVEAGPGTVLWSIHPDCPGRVHHEYGVQVVGGVPVPGQATMHSGQLFMEPRDARLTPGHEYLALLWPDGYTTSDLVLPVVSGRVVSPNSGVLHGMRADEALQLLAKWSQGRSH